jgi:hypothetical protein
MYEIEIASNGITFKLNFMKIYESVQKLKRRKHADTMLTS